MKLRISVASKFGNGKTYIEKQQYYEYVMCLVLEGYQKECPTYFNKQAYWQLLKS